MINLETVRIPPAPSHNIILQGLKSSMSRHSSVFRKQKHFQNKLEDQTDFALSILWELSETVLLIKQLSFSSFYSVVSMLY